MATEKKTKTFPIWKESIEKQVEDIAIKRSLHGGRKLLSKNPTIKERVEVYLGASYRAFKNTGHEFHAGGTRAYDHVLSILETQVKSQ